MGVCATLDDGRIPRVQIPGVQGGCIGSIPRGFALPSADPVAKTEEFSAPCFVREPPLPVWMPSLFEVGIKAINPRRSGGQGGLLKSWGCGQFGLRKFHSSSVGWRSSRWFASAVREPSLFRGNRGIKTLLQRNAKTTSQDRIFNSPGVAQATLNLAFGQTTASRRCPRGLELRNAWS